MLMMQLEEAVGGLWCFNIQVILWSIFENDFFQVSLIGVSEILSSVLTIEMIMCSLHGVYTASHGNIHIDAPATENLKEQEQLQAD